MASSYIHTVLYHIHYTVFSSLSLSLSLSAWEQKPTTVAIAIVIVIDLLAHSRPVSSFV